MSAPPDQPKPLADTMKDYTTKEACDCLRELLPTADCICAEKQHWTSLQRGEYQRYSVSVQPALDGDVCQNFYGDSLHSCIEQVRAYKPKLVNAE